MVGFDGSTTIGEFVQTLNQEIGCRDVSQSGMALYSDDPFQPEQRHLLQKDAKVRHGPRRDGRGRGGTRRRSGLGGDEAGGEYWALSVMVVCGFLC